MKTHTHTDKNFLPPYFQGAQMIRYVPPIYEYEERYDDEQEEYYEDRQCINEEECTSHETLAEKVQSEQHPIYFFRRTLREAKWSMQRLQSIVSFRKFKLTIARFNRRVLIIPTDKHKKITVEIKKKIDKNTESKYNTNLYHNMKDYFEQQMLCIKRQGD